MSSEWKTYLFRELCDITRGASPRPIHDFLGEEGMPWVKIADATAESSRFMQSTKERIKLSGVRASVEVFPGDLILSNSATPGLPKFLKINACIHDGWMLLRNFKHLDKDFAYWLLLTERTRLVAQGNGSVFTNLKTDILKNHPVTIPPIATQRTIAQTLNTLDDRIALLRETNATLESIAQAMFKSWFVDFDPVHANAKGRPPEGMSETIPARGTPVCAPGVPPDPSAAAALFPDSFEVSELGSVPRGWKVGKVGDFAIQHKGSINPLKNPETLYEHFSLPAFDSQHMPVLELGTEIKSNKTSVPPDAVLLSKLNPHIPRIWLPVDVGSNAVCSTEFLVFVPAGGTSKEFIYCAFTTPKFKELLCQLVTGTSNSHQRVKPDGVSSMSAVLPPQEVLEVFADVVKPIFERIGHNLGKAQTLATLRDTLLPRLISGQLRLPEAEVALEEVAA